MEYWVAVQKAWFLQNVEKKPGEGSMSIVGCDIGLEPNLFMGTKCPVFDHFQAYFGVNHDATCAPETFVLYS